MLQNTLVAIASLHYQNPGNNHVETGLDFPEIEHQVIWLRRSIDIGGQVYKELIHIDVEKGSLILNEYALNDFIVNKEIRNGRQEKQRR